MTRLLAHRLPSVFGAGMFDDFPEWFPGPVLFNAPARQATSKSLNYPRIDIQESEKELKVTAEIPGMKKGDIQVTVHEGILTISGERKFNYEETKEGVFRREISHGLFKRLFTLPDTVDVDKIDANYEDGLLKIVFPKFEAAKPKRIEIKVR